MGRTSLVFIHCATFVKWSVTKSPICFCYWSRAYFFIFSFVAQCLLFESMVKFLGFSFIVQLLWMPSPNEVHAISLYFPSLYLVFGQFPQGRVAMLCGCLPWQSLPQFWIFIHSAISWNSNAFWTNKRLMEIGKMLISMKFEHLSFKFEQSMETKVLKWNRLIFKLLILQKL